MQMDGEMRTMTEDEVRTLRMHHDRDVRKRAYESLRRVYNTRQNQITLSRTYTQIVKDWVSDVELRGYAGVMSARNVREELDDTTVDMLLQETVEHANLYQRYFELKRKHLGLDTLYDYDATASIASSKRTFDFSEAIQLHLDTVRDFDKEFHAHSVRMLKEGRIDVFPSHGKRGGAFACYTKNSPEFVLLNYTGDLRDVATISHELGHAVHGYLSQIQSHTGFHSPLSLAETASVFCETLLSERLIRTLDDE